MAFRLIAMLTAVAALLGTHCVSMRRTEAKLDSRHCNADMSANSQRRFSYSLFLTVAEMVQNSSNVMLSPMATGSALAMVMGGAKGITKKQIMRVLRLNTGNNYSEANIPCLTGIYRRGKFAVPINLEKSLSGRDDITTLRKATKLYGEKSFSFERDFVRETLRYGSRLQSMDFRKSYEQSRKRINTWVSKHTENRINQLFCEGCIDSNTKLAIVSIIYFKGTWLNVFKDYDTTEGVFHVSESKQVNVKFMDNTAFYRTLRSPSIGANLVELPYRSLSGIGIEASMILISPRESFSLHDLLPVMSEDGLGGLNGLITQLLSRRKSYFNVIVPKFEVSAEHNMKTALRKMGMRQIFNRKNADLTNMVYSGVSKNPLYITTIAHKVMIGANEKGTEVVGATGFGMGLMAEPPRLKFDRPFIVIIMEKVTNSILFIGRICDPSK